MVKPEIATPGVGIASAFSSHLKELELQQDICSSYWTGGPYSYGTNRVLPGEMYRVIQGTSMACPNATGAIALLLAKNSTLTDASLRAIFNTTARKDSAVTVHENAPNSAKTDTDQTAATPNNDWGHGKMDIEAALAATPVFCSAELPCATGKCCGGSCKVPACVSDADCTVAGTTCQSPDTCDAKCAAPCQAAGTSCTLSSQCCSGSCAGKAGKKVCK
jgi:hypothetical protein